MDTMDITKVLKELQKELNKIYKPISNFLGQKPADSEALILAERALKQLPEGLSYLSEKYLPAIQSQLKYTQHQYKKLETAYLRIVRERGDALRESGEGWRVSILMLETKPSHGMARFCYNREVLVPWQAVTSVEHLLAMEEQALGMLQKANLREDKLFHMLWLAYKKAVVDQHNQLEGQKVYIHELMLEFNSLLLRDKELLKPLASFIKNSEVPRWIFLYNLDRYRLVNAASIPAGERIGLQTGSQQEVSSGHGITVNGLVPEEDYKTMCHVIPLQSMAR